MSAKTSAARRAAFFTALAETGNQTISAERARVSRSWVVQQAGDPAFRAEMDVAIRAADERLSAATSDKPSEDWQDIEGDELVLRGVNNRLVQVARARLGQWTPRIEARFLRTLAATCNVTAACKEIGVTKQSAYLRRNKWKSFAERWEEALEIGYARLEMALLENGCNMLEDVEVDPDAPMLPMTVEQAIQFMGLHRRQVKRERRGVHRFYRVPELSEVKDDIKRKVAAIMRAREMKARPLPDFMRDAD
jgi:hypothetical protein